MTIDYDYDEILKPPLFIEDWFSRQGYEGDVEGMGGVLFSIVVNAERIRREWAPALQSINRIEDNPERVLEVVTDMISCVKNLQSLCEGYWGTSAGISHFVSPWLPEENAEG